MASSGYVCCVCRAELPVPSVKRTHELRCREAHGFIEESDMPTSPPSVCLEPGCGTPSRKPRCPEHARERERETHDSGRQKVYHSRQWKAVRRRVLARDVWCKAPGCNNLATDVDHIVALRDSDDPFDEVNLQALCKRHHSQKTAAEVWGRKA